MLHLIDPSSYQERYTTVRYVILEFIRVHCYTRFREQKWLVFLKCSFYGGSYGTHRFFHRKINYDLQMQNMHRKVVLFFN